MIDQDLKDFGKHIGIHNLQFPEGTDCLRLQVENAGDLYIERFNDEVFFYLLKDYGDKLIPSTCYHEALAMAYSQEAYPFFIHPIADEGNQIGFFVRLSQQACNLPNMHKLLDTFIQLIQKLEKHFHE